MILRQAGKEALTILEPVLCPVSENEKVGFDFEGFGFVKKEKSPGLLINPRAFLVLV